MIFILIIRSITAICGIAGFLGRVPSFVSCLSSMAHSISHRGPDDSGIWFDEQLGVGLAHARLSILDLTSAGHQPMHSLSSRYVLIFNGEIYNHHSIRLELEALSFRNWRSHSDTETLLCAIDHWGLEATLKKISGMFAFALWDREERTLSLARDRIGEKPLYFGWVKNVFAFASELTAFKSLDGFDNIVDRKSLSLFLRLSSIPAPYSIYKDIYKLQPGYVAAIDLDSCQVKHHCYWSTESFFTEKLNSRFYRSSDKVVNGFEKILSNVVAKQMISDVPLGAFLSGGIDSSLIVSLMQSQSSRKINTFTIGFHQSEFNEAKYAKEVANHLGTNHVDLYVTEQEALDVISYLPDIYDEPFADPSQIPTYLVSKLAKQDVKVALSGDAGDELFGGYNRYLFAKNYFHKFNKLPLSLRTYISKLILSQNEARLDMVFEKFSMKYFAHIGAKLHKSANVLSSQSIKEMHLKLISQIQSPGDWLINSEEHTSLFTDGEDHFHDFDSIEQMMMYDLMTYLPSDILTKIDRSAMYVSLETRVPFLDSDVLDFAASLPFEYKIRDGVTKWILREVLYKYVPKRLIERPKMGFAVPLAYWLRGPLRHWAESMLDVRSLREDGFFNVAMVQRKWSEHLSGKYNWSSQLWNVLMFQAWLLKNR